MNKILQASFILLAFLLTGVLASGQVKFTTRLSSQEIGRGEYLQVDFVIENASQVGQLNLPDFQGFQVVQGPSQSNETTIVNGHVTQTVSLSYVLQPAKTGKFIISGASANIDGKQMRSNSVTVMVTANSTGHSSNSNNSGSAFPSSAFPSMNFPDPFAGPSDADRDIILRPGENAKEKIRKNLFLKLDVDKTTCYVGEPIVATYKLYSHLEAESRMTKRPSLNGFSVYDMVDPNSDAAASVERVNGKDFLVHVLRKTQLIPLQAGTVDLDPMEMENTVHFIKGTRRQQNRSRSGNPFRDFFNQPDDDDLGPEITENVTLDTKATPITVKPLPEENKPAGFGGAVGSFSIEASLGSRDLAAEDEGTLHLVIRGKGNLPVINAPQVQWPAGVEAFDPKAKDDINKTVVPMSGSKTFDYVFTSRNPGHYTIPAINFPYFDPATASYKTAATAPMDLQVSPAVRKNGSSLALPAAGPPVRVMNGDMLRRLVQAHLEWIFAVIILSCVAFYLWRQNLRLKKKEQEQQEAAAKKAAEDKVAEKQMQQTPLSNAFTPAVPVADPLQETRLLFGQGDYKGFYREVNRAVWKAIANKLDIPASELNKHNVIRLLEIKGWDKHMTFSLESLLNECEMNLYTPAYDTYNMQQLLRQAEGMMGLLV